MSGQQFNYNMWQHDGWIPDEQFHFSNETTENINIQHDEYIASDDISAQHFYSGNNLSKMAFFYEPPNQGLGHSSKMQENQIGQKIVYERTEGNDEFNERPLLEELEIYPDQILQKIKVVLDPFRHNIPSDSDLGGPLLFYLCLAFSMFLSGGKFNFSYVYGISVTGCIMMYFLLQVMTNCDKLTFMAVASVLGYSILPIVLFSGFGILFSLRNVFGYVMAFITICWASHSASKIFCLLTENYSQRSLIMYPCALLYGVFILLVIF